MYLVGFGLFIRTLQMHLENLNMRKYCKTTCRPLWLFLPLAVIVTSDNTHYPWNEVRAFNESTSDLLRQSDTVHVDMN